MKSKGKGRFVAAVLLAASAAAMPAHAGTWCEVGGLTPGFAVIELDLPGGSDVMGLGVGGRRATQPVNGEEEWHLAMGIIIVNADTHEIPAYWILTEGWTPPRAVVEYNGSRIVDEYVPAPDGFAGDESGRIPDGLPPGRYYAVSFGVGGGNGILGPNEWRTKVFTAEQHDCTVIQTGETFDYNHTDFTGGTQIYAPPGVGYADGVSLEFTTARNLVVGLISAEVLTPPVGRDVRLDYTTPTGGGTHAYHVRPFASAAGTYRFQAKYQGVYPSITIAGVTVDVD